MTMSSKTEFMQALAKAKDRLAKVKAESNDYAERTVETAMTLGGGAIAGYMQNKYPDKEVLGVNAGLAISAALTIVGITDWAGKQSRALGAVGEGMLAYEVGRRVAQGKWSASGEAQLVGAAFPLLPLQLTQGAVNAGAPVTIDQLVRSMR